MKQLQLLFFTTLFALSSNAQNWIFSQPPPTFLGGILSSTLQDYEQFGHDVAISGDFAVIASPGHDLDAQDLNPISGAGAVFVYKKIGGVWTFYQKIVAVDRAQSDIFGYSVAISGDYIIAGAPYDCEDENGNNCLTNSGAVYIFKLNNGVWEQQQRIVASDRGQDNLFGWVSDIDGDYIVVGSIWETEDENGQNPLYQAGAAYVFKQTAGVWVQQQKIVPDDRSAEDAFAYNVAVSGDRIICGAYGQDFDASGNNSVNGAGAAYIFKRNGTSWAQEQKLVNIDRSANGWFGWAVDIDGDNVVISAVGNTTDENNQNPIPNVGAAYVFIRDQTGWIQQSKLVPDDRAYGSNFFGNDVAINGNYMLIGMAQDDSDINGTNRAGAAYLFLLNNHWKQHEKLTAYFSYTDYYFGTAVGIDGANCIIGEVGFSDLGYYTLLGDVYFFEPAPLSIDVDANAASCQNAADGSVDVTLTGGYAPFEVTVGNNTLTSSGTVYGLSAGNYTVAVTDGLDSAASELITIGQGSSVCAGRIILEADARADYFDTITVTVSIADAANLFSVYGKLYFDSTLLYLLDYTEEGFFGTTNIITTPPVVLNGVIDFGVTKTVGQVGVNGSGAFFTFRFVLHDFPVNVPFYTLNPDSIATLFSLDNLTIYDAVGLEREVETPAPAVTFLRYYIPVWPGDLNSDYQVNVADILPIGYFYNNIGPVRPNASLQWVAQPAQLWGFDRTFRNSSAYQTFADGNGNGLIDLADQSAIGFNLSRVHNFQIPAADNREKGGNLPPLTAELVPEYLDSTQLPVTLAIPVMIGSSFSPVSNLYGIAFDLLFDAGYVDTNTIQLDYNNTIFGTQNVDYIRIEDLHPGDGRLSIGLTRYNSTELFAMGDEVLTVTLTIRADVATGWFKFYTVPLDANDILGADIDIQGSGDSIYIVTPIPNSVAQIEKPVRLSVYPNPAGNSITVATDAEINSTAWLNIYNATGQLVHAETLLSNQQQINVSDLSSGVYMLELQTTDGTQKQKLIIQR